MEENHIYIMNIKNLTEYITMLYFNTCDHDVEWIENNFQT